MRILIDSYWWHRGPVSLQRVVHGLVAEWRVRYPQDEIYALVRRPGSAERFPEIPGVFFVSTSVRPHALSATFVLPILARRLKADVVLAQNYSPLLGVPSSVFIQDVLFKTNPEWFTAIERFYFRPMLWTARRADVVFASTRFTASEIERLGVSMPPVVTVGLGLSVDLLNKTPFRPAVLGSHVNGFVLSVGRINVRKNLSVLLRAAAESSGITVNLPLVVVGEKDGRAMSDDTDLAAFMRTGRVIFAGRVSDEELNWLYAEARLFVFLSLGEGYGLPPVEAMSYGCPVLVSDIPVFRETCGDAAHYVDSKSVNAVSSAIDDLLRRRDEPTLADAREKVLSAHSWRAVVERMRDHLMSLVNDSRV